MTTTTTTTCKRCGQPDLAWVQSKKTGRWYLAHTQRYHGAALGGDRGYSRGGISVLAHQPHNCDQDRPLCDKCGVRHDRFATDLCEARQRDARRQAEADQPLDWKTWTASHGGTIAALERADFDIRVREMKDNSWELEYNFRTVPVASGLQNWDVEEGFATLDAAQARALELIALVG